MEHEFTESIRRILYSHFGQDADEILSGSDLIQYLNYKTRSASRGSKARGSFANIYAIYVLVEDYVERDFDVNDDYSDYEGAQFSELFRRQRELPFGSNLQNHALNNRLNDEFRGRFPQQNLQPILRDRDTSRYWFNENLLTVEELINIPRLIHILNELSVEGRIVDVVDEILLYSKVEFDYSVQN